MRLIEYRSWQRLSGRGLCVLLAVVAVAVAARLTIPLPGGTVPQSGQTLAVLVAGGLLGPVLGPVAMIVYVLAGAVGMPVFAEGRSGLEVVVGSSAGYLGGFVVAAWVMTRVCQHRFHFGQKRQFRMDTFQLLSPPPCWSIS